jgi:hypothetical protein
VRSVSLRGRRRFGGAEVERARLLHQSSTRHSSRNSCHFRNILQKGDIAQGRVHFDQALALYNPAEHRPLLTRFGQDVRVAILFQRSLCLWLLGYPDAALLDAADALGDAREIGHAATVTYALLFTWFTHIFCGNCSTATAQSDEIVALANEKGSVLWNACGVVVQGCVAASTGRASDANRAAAGFSLICTGPTPTRRLPPTARSETMCDRRRFGMAREGRRRTGMIHAGHRGGTGQRHRSARTKLGGLLPTEPRPAPRQCPQP